jgi:hypothetical protein
LCDGDVAEAVPLPGLPQGSRWGEWSMPECEGSGSLAQIVELRLEACGTARIACVEGLSERLFMFVLP